MTGKATVFLLMLQKNFILQVRRPIGTLLELLLPPLAMAVIILLGFLAYDIRHHCFVTFDSDPLTLSLPENRYQIYYTPIDSNTEAIANLMRRKLPYADIVGANTEQEVLANLTDVLAPFVVNVSDGGSVVERELGCLIGGAGVVFESLESNNLEYTLRLRHEVGFFRTWYTDRVAVANFETLEPRESENFYLQEGFLHLESVVGESIIEWKAGEPLMDIQVSVRQLPYPEYSQNEFLEQLFETPDILPFVVIFSLIYSVGIFTKELVLEKDTRIRELLLITGLKQWVLWMAWYIKQLVFLLFIALVMSIMIKFGQVLPESDFSLILVFMILFMVSAISFSFMISVFFSSARIGLLAGILFWFIFFLPYLFMGSFPQFSVGVKIAISLLSNSCVGLGIDVFTLFEITGDGAQWKDLFKAASFDNDFKVGYTFIMLIVDAILYMVIAWYVDAVKPGKYGVPKPLYFPFLPSYWTGQPRTQQKESKAFEMQELSDGTTSNSKAHEEEPKDLEVGISIHGLVKVYKESILQKMFTIHKKGQGRERVKVAVNDLSLNIFKDQITVLLGHNGAGKTTTMSILTGIYTPTGGTAIINGYDIRTNMEQIRRNLGICPQHNVLFERLTVDEQLKLFGRIKGMSRKDLQREIDELLADLRLVDKRDTPTVQLSGGQKRKLSVAIALIGGSKIVVLDEPTSGMDPYARRDTWDLLNKHKHGRTILLSTHFMDEADLLGDRIAIMNEGSLHCSGSSLFLKSRYGVGYHMVIEKAPTCDSIKVVDIVKSLVHGGKCVLDAGAELSFILPSQATASFPSLFEELESKKDELGIAGFGVSVTTMEEVFLKVRDGTAESIEHRLDRTRTLVHQPSYTHSQPTTPASSSQHVESTLASNRYSGLVLWTVQLYAMLTKRFYTTVRFWQFTLLQQLVPIFFVLVAMIFAVTSPVFMGDDPKRALRIDNSALDPNNRLLFWAEVGQDPTTLFDFASINARDLGATVFSDYSAGVMDIIDNNVHTENDIMQCCNYTHQILDKYCAAETLGNFSNLNFCGDTPFSNSFGYRRCTHCLQYCEARVDVPPSCTNPDTQFSFGGSCPSPPKLSLNDYLRDTTGRLDSDNTYVNEHLLRVAERMGASTYSSRVQGGITLSYTGIILTDILDAYIEEDSGSGSGDGSIVGSLQPSIQLECNQTDDRPVGAVFAPFTPEITATVWYNNIPTHMPAAMLNAFHNVWLRNVTGNSTLSIMVNNHPLPSTTVSQIRQLEETNGVFTGVLVVGGYSFLLASFVVFIVGEKESKAKHLQFVSGVHATSYWLSTALWDTLNAMIFVLASTLIFYAFQIESYQGEGLLALFLLLSLTCFTGICVTYLLSYFFTKSLIAYAVIFIIHFFPSALGLYVVITLVTDFSTADTLHHAFLLFPAYGFVAGLNDVYTNDIIKRFCTASPEAQFECDNFESIRYVDNIFSLSRPGIEATFIYLCAEIVIFPALLLLIEKSFFVPDIKRLIKRNKDETTNHVVEVEEGALRQLALGALPLCLRNKDSDVLAEREKVRRGEIAEDDIVIIRNLRKVYPSSLDGFTVRPPKAALRGISLIIPKGECFGLLGVNGAGKTTAFRLLTGDLLPTSGTAIITGFDIVSDLRKVQRQIGYCPQFDALIEKLTGRELLTIFARLRGISNRLIKQSVDAEIQKLDLTSHADKQCGNYSGGNKRKLSTAIALIGNPPIVFLDEPTSGMDPSTRHYLWNVLTGVVREGRRSIVLTTHSMEECEALCTRLAIMVNGEFKCLGSLQHLKNKYGAGFSLQAKVNLPPSPEEPKTPQRRFSFVRTLTRRSTTPRHSSFSANPQADSQRRVSSASRTLTRMASLVSPRALSQALSLEDEPFDPYNTTALHEFIKRSFPAATLLEEHQGSVSYQIPATRGVTWSSVFQSLESNKEELSIVDYSISQTTLEQVFINFARKQGEK